MAYPSMVTKYKQVKYNVTKCSNRRSNKSVKYTVIHYTGTNASAKNNCIYFGGGNRNASADYFIDTDGTIYKFNGDCANYYSWHCGDGHGKHGIKNSNSIGIEVVSAGKEYAEAQKKSLKALVQAIMDDYGVKAENVVRHYDASRKNCPAPYCGSTQKDKKWAALKKLITAKSSSTSKPNSKFEPYKVKITASTLNIRKGPGTNYDISGKAKKNGVYTIIGEASGKGATKWLELKSGKGYISLDYVKKI